MESLCVKLSMNEEIEANYVSGIRLQILNLQLSRTLKC